MGITLLSDNLNLKKYSILQMIPEWILAKNNFNRLNHFISFGKEIRNFILMVESNLETFGSLS